MGTHSAKPFTLVTRHVESGQFTRSHVAAHVAALLRTRKRTPRKPRIPPRATREAAFKTSPTIANAYAKWIKAIMRRVFDAMRVRLEPAWREVFRADAIPVRMVHAFEQVNIAVAEIIDEKKIGAQAGRVAGQVDTLTQGQFKQLLRAQSVPPDVHLQNAFIEKNVQLIKSLADEQINRVRAVIEQAAITGEHPKEIAKQFEAEFEISQSRAELIARDQVLKLHGDLVEDRQTALGIEQYIWTTSGDERVRPDHADLDGTIQDWNNPPEVDARTGRREHPGRDFQCRCVAFPLLTELQGLDVDL